MNVRLKTLISFAIVLLVGAVVWMLLPAGETAPPAAPARAPQPSAAAQRDEGDAAAQRIAVEANPDAASLTLRGRVLDPYGEPVAGALVGDAEAAAPVRTAADGGFALRVDVGARAMTLLVLAAGHAPLLFDVEPGAGERDLGDVLLRHAGSIRGSVTTTGGQPLPAVAMTLAWQGAALPAGLDLERLLPVASSEADGSYTFANLMPGSYRVRAAVEGMQRGQSARLTVREGQECLAAPIALAVGYELRGLVLGPGDVPVAGAAVRIEDRGNPRFREAVATDADGAFVATAVPPGPLRVEVTSPGYLSSSRADVDATRGERLVMRLETGLGIRGIAVDARSGKPVQRFAVELRRLGELDPASNGTMVQQLQRQVEALRAPASDSTGEPLQVAAQLQARLAAVQQPVGPVPVPADVGPMLERPQGRFACDGLQEGVYTVGIASPDHQYAESAPIELRRGRLAAELRIELSTGHRVTGAVVSRRTGAAIAGARVELLHPLAPGRELAPSPYPWAFAPAAPAAAVMATDTGDDGRFAFAAVGAGAWRLTVRQAQIADHDSDVFYVQQDGIDLRIAVDERASLFGRVHPARAMPAGIEVLVLGGHGTLRTTKAGSDGSYRFELLQPGSYLVRAFAADARQYQQRLLGSLFGSGAGGEQPQCDLTLAPGECRGFDLDLDQPAAGAVAGTFAINGQPARGGRVVLQPVPGEAPGSGGLPLRGSCDELGRFQLADVPAGNYAAQWFGATRQELHRQAVRVEPGANVELRIEAAAGAVRGHILAADAAPAELRGYVWVLPGAAAAPDDLYEYRREHRSHRIAVQAGAFEDAALTPGPAVVVADIRGRRRLSTTAVVPAGGVLLLELPMALSGR